MNKRQLPAKVNWKRTSPLRCIQSRSWWGLKRRAFVDVALTRALIKTRGEDGILRFDETLDPDRALVDRRRRRVHRVPVPNSDENLILKYEFFPFPNWIFTLPRSPIGIREMKNLRIVSALGVRSFTPVLSGDVSWGPFFLRSFVATEEVPHGCGLTAWLRDSKKCLREAFPSPELRDALPELATALATLHRNGFYCRTPVAKNVYMSRDDGDNIRFFMHDLPRPLYRPGEPLSVRRASRDLARMDKWAVHWLTKRERVKLLRHYLSELLEEKTVDRARLLIWLRWLTHHRRLLHRRTFLSWATHWVRRRSKQMPFFGKWWR